MVDKPYLRIIILKGTLLCTLLCTDRCVYVYIFLSLIFSAPYGSLRSNQGSNFHLFAMLSEPKKFTEFLHLIPKLLQPLIYNIFEYLQAPDNHVLVFKRILL